MQQHIDQVGHNQKFHDCLAANFATQFFDWKITVCFYTGLHMIHALAQKKGIDIGCTHSEVSKSINPFSSTAVMPINQQAFKHYRALYKYSRIARYDGISDLNTFEQLRQRDYQDCQHHLTELKKYIINSGVPV